MTDDVVDSPNAFVADHIRRFEATGGHPRPGMNDLLLTTRGRRSGKLRRTALVYAAGSRERPRLWDLMVAAMPSYRGYQETTSREIPVVVLYSGR